MPSPVRSHAPVARRLRLTRHILALASFALAPLAARAVVVRGTVTDSLGAPVPGARVQLIQGQSTSAVAISGCNGSFEIRSGDSGRFLLLTSAATFAPNIGADFYGGQSDILTRDVVLSPAEIRSQISVTATGVPTPVAQLTAPVTLIARDALATRLGIVDDLRQSPGVTVVQTGQAGGVASLFVRGGNSDANKVLIDGIPAEDVGGSFDFGTLSSTALAGPLRQPSPGSAVELYRGPNSALYGSDSTASVVSLSTPRGVSLRPVLNYSGDAGNLHSWRNEAMLSGTRSRLDYLLAFSRFDTSNALPLDRYHAATSAANLGYNLTANTQARFTLRNAVSASGLPNAYNFYNLVQNGRQSDQDIYSGITVENTTPAGWHNLVRYGIARKREQGVYFGDVGTPTLIFGFPSFLGHSVLIRGANAYTATGRAQLFTTNRDQDSNRDELYAQSDYTFAHHISALLGFRYENERGSFNIPAYFEFRSIQRTNFQGNAQIQGDLRNRLFFSVGGGIQKNHLYGLAGTPRLGLAFVPVRPSSALFHGTRIRANAATGVQEPSLATEFNSLSRELLSLGDTAAISRFGVQPLGPERSRTFDVGVDQDILGERLVLKGGYFHNQFSHQLEYVGKGDLKTYFGFTPSTSAAAYFYGAELNSLAFRAQGFETELQFQPVSRLLLRGGYTWLDARVSQSFAGDVTSARQGFPTVNPNLPDIAIGATSPLLGARPFRRPPHTGFFAAQYTAQKWSAALKGAMASRSDDSTFLGYSDQNDGNSLLLPNRNLDFGYAKLDAYGTWAATSRVTVFSDVSNLLNNQHIGPIGYPSLPLTVRGGVKVRLGGD